MWPVGRSLPTPVPLTAVYVWKTHELMLIIMFMTSNELHFRFIGALWTSFNSGLRDIFSSFVGHVTKGDEHPSGGVALPAFRLYMAACGGSTPCLLILALFVLNVGSSTFCQWWLSYWINQGSGVRLLPPSPPLPDFTFVLRTPPLTLLVQTPSLSPPPSPPYASVLPLLLLLLPTPPTTPPSTNSSSVSLRLLLQLLLSCPHSISSSPFSSVLLTTPPSPDFTSLPTLPPPLPPGSSSKLLRCEQQQQ